MRGSSAVVGCCSCRCDLLVGGVQYTLWYPVSPRTPLDNFSYLNGNSVGNLAAAAIRASAPDAYRTGAIGSTDLGDWQGDTASGGRLPALVVFAHGLDAFPYIASELCERLVQTGRYIVAAPTLSTDEDLGARLAAVSATIDNCMAMHGGHRLDPANIAMVGHSRGGCAAAVLALTDRRVCCAVCLSSNAGDTRSLLPRAPRAATTERTERDKPPALLTIHAADGRGETIMPAEWAELLAEVAPHTTAHMHALVVRPAPHDWCTSLYTELSFKMPPWLQSVLRGLSSHVAVLQEIFPDGLVQSRAQELVGLAVETTTEFIDGAMEAAAGAEPTRDNGVSKLHAKVEGWLGRFEAEAERRQRLGLWRLTPRARL